MLKEATFSTRFLRWAGVLAVVCCAALLYAHPTAAVDEAGPPFKLPPQHELLRVRSAVMHTNKGSIYFRLYPEDAPWHVANFKYLADRGFYRNLPFHIYEPNFVIQAGAPGPRVNSGPGYTLPAEFNSRKHEEGSLSMVRKPDDLDANHTRRSHGSQFRILMRSAPNMDGQYVVFGKVIKGMDVARSLRQGDVIKDVHVFVKPLAAAAPARPQAGSGAGFTEPNAPLPPPAPPF